ncbi:MAG: futalosine hydrolase [Desulfuromonas sp.]|nr:MAG: futalosine hydrolase [Desulfuromonas sp.]
MILVLAATPIETELLRHQAGLLTPLADNPYGLFSGTTYRQSFLLAHGGIGASTMAMSLTRILGVHRPAAIVLIGCGGSYPGSGLAIGDLALAEREIWGDIGVTTADGFIPLEQLKLPQDKELTPLFRQDYHLDENLCRLARTALPTVRSGTFVTVNCCSGTPELSREFEHRCAGLCENMEGAAVAQVCDEFSVPLLELRGISNPTGTRDPAQWDIRAGAEAAQNGLLELLKNWPV